MQNMLFIVWSEEYEMKISIIDEQHRSLVGIINSLFYLMNNKLATNVFHPTLVLLEQYAHIHFLTEETLLEKTRYPRIEEHKKAHNAFRAKTQLLISQNRRTQDATNLLDFLKTWFTTHTMQVDRDFAEHVIKALKNNEKKSPPTQVGQWRRHVS